MTDAKAGARRVDASSLRDLPAPERERGVPLIRACFTGYYRWHAKRTLRDIERVRVVEVAGEIVGLAMLERLVPEVGYVYYLAVDPRHRRGGIGGLLLDDALAIFRQAGASVAYGAVEEENEPSLRLFRSRGFRTVERKELGYQEGGLGAWGLRTRMRIVYGEVLLGLRLGAPPPEDRAAPSEP